MKAKEIVVWVVVALVVSTVAFLVTPAIWQNIAESQHKATFEKYLSEHPAEREYWEKRVQSEIT